MTHRFINADAVYVSTGTSILGHNMFAYCDNNPVNRYDPTGCSWLSDAWNSVKNFGKKVWNSFTNWCSNTFGSGTVQTQTYKTATADTVLWGEETGTSTTGVISGDISKPISFCFENATDWWRTTEYKVGIQVNLKNGNGGSFSYGFSEISATLSTGNTTYTGIAGINKFGYTISYDANFTHHTASSYYHTYIRTIPTALAVVGGVAAVYYTGGAVFGAIPVAYNLAPT